MAEAEFAGTGRCECYTAIVYQAGTRRQGQFQPGLQIKEGDSAVLKFLADDAFGLQAQAVAIEMQRSFQIVYAQGDDADTRLHCLFLQSGQCSFY
ncbi:hypothetical protein D3C81_1891880 [compost metagenome]